MDCFIGKVSLFYAVFYACLGSFFVGMLAVFMSIMPKDRPTYYGESSTMNIRKINPGLGFRPQVDVEDHLILFAPTVLENDKNGFKPFVNNLNNFLDKSKFFSSLLILRLMTLMLGLFKNTQLDNKMLLTVSPVATIKPN